MRVFHGVEVRFDTLPILPNNLIERLSLLMTVWSMWHQLRHYLLIGGYAKCGDTFQDPDSLGSHVDGIHMDQKCNDGAWSQFLGLNGIRRDGSVR